MRQNRNNIFEFEFETIVYMHGRAANFIIDDAQHQGFFFQLFLDDLLGFFAGLFVVFPIASLALHGAVSDLQASIASLESFSLCTRGSATRAGLERYASRGWFLLLQALHHYFAEAFPAKKTLWLVKQERQKLRRRRSEQLYTQRFRSRYRWSKES
jgi:hypothetical protein